MSCRHILLLSYILFFSSFCVANYITLHYTSYLVYASYKKKLSTGVLQSPILTIYSTYH